jgi:hypothetical protein
VSSTASCRTATICSTTPSNDSMTRKEWKKYGSASGMDTAGLDVHARPTRSRPQPRSRPSRAHGTTAMQAALPGQRQARVGHPAHCHPRYDEGAPRRSFEFGVLERVPSQPQSRQDDRGDRDEEHSERRHEHRDQERQRPQADEERYRTHELTVTMQGRAVRSVSRPSVEESSDSDA